MLIALLAVLGVDLIVLVALAAFVFARKRRVKRQPGAFRGVLRVASGAVDGLADRLEEQGRARTDEVKRLGDHPGVIRVTADGATIEVAAKAEDRELGPYRKAADATAAGSERL
jgi:hypothetical protein